MSTQDDYTIRQDACRAIAAVVTYLTGPEGEVVKELVTVDKCKVTRRHAARTGWAVANLAVPAKTSVADK
jgi:hypothetical protein